MSKNSNIVFKILSTHFVVVVWILNQQRTFSFLRFCLSFSHCPTYITERLTLHSTIENIDNNLLDHCEPVLIRTLLFGSNSFDIHANTNVLNATIEYTLSTKRFDESLFQWKQKISKLGNESVYSVFITVVTCTICKFLIYFLRISFILGYSYNFRYLPIASINFRVYDMI